MKDSITNSIIQQMLSVLDNAQLKQLKKAIETTLADYEIVKCDENKQTETDEIVIEKFLSAKRVEGCSEKSLRYYKSTIMIMLGKIEKSIDHITTDDLREYLTAYQSEKNSSMIILRQGKPKTILENSINSALTAVETYNRPKATFRMENFIILMIIAWTKLFHAYFHVTIGGKYFYKEKNGRYKIIDGEKKGWELKECIKNYQKKSSHKLSAAVVANLELFIGIRNKIEHRYWSSSALDIVLFGECQALLYNYENLLIALFGEEYSLNTCLAYALQFSHLRSPQQLIAQKDLLSRDMQDIKKYIDKYKTDLPQEIFDNQEYSIKLLQIPKISNTNRLDLSVEFVNWNAINEEERESYRKISVLIKDKIVKQPVSNANMLKPGAVIKAVEEKTGIHLSQSNHTDLWKAFRVRPANNSDSKFDTIVQFCIYDEAHNDYLYTVQWVDFITKLITVYGFSKENMRLKCSTMLSINDYK